MVYVLVTFGIHHFFPEGRRLSRQKKKSPGSFRIPDRRRQTAPSTCKTMVAVALHVPSSLIGSSPACWPAFSRMTRPMVSVE